MSFLQYKKLFYTKTTSLNDKINVFSTEKQARKIFGTSYQNHGLTPFQICKFFDHSEMSFVWPKKVPSEKTTSSNDNPKVSCREKQATKIFGIFHLKNVLTSSKYADFSTAEKCHFYDFESLLLRKQHHETTKPMSLLQKRRLERYLELLTRNMG